MKRTPKVVVCPQCFEFVKVSRFNKYKTITCPSCGIEVANVR